MIGFLMIAVIIATIAFVVNPALSVKFLRTKEPTRVLPVFIGSVMFLLLVIVGGASGAFKVEVKQILDVKQIAGKKKGDVEKVIGKPSSCEWTSLGETCQYSNNVDVTYRNGLADWISISGIKDLRFDGQALKAVGLKPGLRDPDNDAPAAKGWGDHDGMKEVSISGDNKIGTEMINVKALTTMDGKPPFWRQRARKAFETQFSGYDGSHTKLVSAVKKGMHDPGSFDHVSTKFAIDDSGQNAVVEMTFRGANMFGAKVVNRVVAVVDTEGRILSMQQ